MADSYTIAVIIVVIIISFCIASFLLWQSYLRRNPRIMDSENEAEEVLTHKPVGMMTMDEMNKRISDIDAGDISDNIVHANEDAETFDDGVGLP